MSREPYSPSSLVNEIPSSNPIQNLKLNYSSNVETHSGESPENEWVHGEWSGWNGWTNHNVDSDWGNWNASYSSWGEHGSSSSDWHSGWNGSAPRTNQNSVDKHDNDVNNSKYNNTENFNSKTSNSNY